MNQVTSVCFALTFFICLLICTCTAQSGPRNVLLTPAIYIASEGNSVAVQFTCTSPQPAAIFLVVDGSPIDTLLQQTRGITTNKLSETVTALYILPLQLNHNTSVSCFVILDMVPSYSAEGVLLIQGQLSAPPRLTIMNSTLPNYRLLSWTPPFTLDLTDQEPDITGYRVCINFSSLDAAAEEMSLHCILTQDISYTYPNVRLPLQFSVTPLNVVGDGNSSFATHQPCTAAPDFMAVDEAMLQVSLSADGRYSINASFRLPPQTTCYDAYQLVLVNSSSSSSPFSVVSPILLPSITKLDPQMLQVLHKFADLAENTIYSVSLLATNINGEMRVYNGFSISTYDIQAVSLTEEGPGSLKLTCDFLANSTAQGCRLTLCKLYDEVSLPCMNVDLSRDSPIVVLEDLVGGVYMITHVSALEEDGNLSVLSDLSPLALQQIALNKSQSASTSSAPSTSTGGEEGPNPTTRSNIAIIIGPVGAVLVVIILVVLIIILIIIYFYEMKKRSYSFKVRRNKTPHTRTLVHFEDVDGTGKNKAGTTVTKATHTGTQHEDESQSHVSVVSVDLSGEICTTPPTSPLYNIQQGGKQSPNCAMMTSQGGRDSMFKYSNISAPSLPPPPVWVGPLDNSPQEDLPPPQDRHAASPNVGKVDLTTNSSSQQSRHSQSSPFYMPPKYAEVMHVTTPLSKTPRDRTSVFYSELRLDNDPPDVPNGLNGQSKSPIVRNSGVKVGEVGNSVLYDDSIGHRV